MTEWQSHSHDSGRLGNGLMQIQLFRDRPLRSLGDSREALLSQKKARFCRDKQRRVQGLSAHRQWSCTWGSQPRSSSSAATT